MATAFARTEYGIAQYDTALYTTIYFEKYKAWLVICNYAPQEKGEMVVRPAKEWGIHVLIGGDGRLIRFFDSIYDETINTEVASQVYSRFDNNDIRPYLVE